MRQRIPWDQVAIGLAFAVGIGFLLRVFAHASTVVSWLAAGIFFVALLIALQLNR